MIRKAFKNVFGIWSGTSILLSVFMLPQNLTNSLRNSEWIFFLFLVFLYTKGKVVDSLAFLEGAGFVFPFTAVGSLNKFNSHCKIFVVS